jgi:predicted lactoylglutathione lyase
MLSYALVGSNNLEAAKNFYDQVLAVMGVPSLMEHQSGGRLYGHMGQPMFGVVGPFNQQPATVGNGTMIAWACKSREEVDQVYKKAIELGGTDDGAPGLRGPAEYNLYFAYFRDLDGNKIAVSKMGA